MKSYARPARKVVRKYHGRMLSWLSRAFRPLPLALTVTLACASAAPSAELALLDLTDRQVDPFDGAEATVFVFAAVDCPISNRYAPEIRRLYEKFSGEKVAFWLVYANPDETPEMIRAHLEDFSYPVPALRDPKHTLVALTHAEITPEAAVFNAQRELVYRGRIDNWYVAFGKRRPAPTVHDLQDAVDAVLGGRPVARATAPAVGCYIPSLE